MNTIRVLHAIGKMNRGGAETFLMELYRQIDRSIIQFDFLVFQYDDDPGAFDDEIYQLGGNIYRFKMNKAKSPISFYYRLCAFFSEDKVHNIVHSHQYTMSGYIAFVAKKYGKTTISHAHAIRKNRKLSIREIYNLIGIMLIKQHSDFFFGCSDEALFSLTGMHADNRKAFIIKNAINANKFYYSESERIIQREKYKFTDEKVIGCVGRFSKVKNQMFLISIFRKAVEHDPKLRLVFVGGGNGEKAAKQLVSELGLGNSCLFLGIRDDVYNLINLFDAFCLPSLNEGLGIVYIEAQCNGLNCIIPLETVPDEVDIGANLVKRMSFNATDDEWAMSLVEVAKLPRIDNALIKECIRKSGYDITLSKKWLQEFYINHSKGY